MKFKQAKMMSYFNLVLLVLILQIVNVSYNGSSLMFHYPLETLTVKKKKNLAV